MWWMGPGISAEDPAARRPQIHVEGLAKATARTDLAIIRVQTDKPLPILEFGDSDQMEVGDRVLAVGCPFGLAGSVTHGIVQRRQEPESAH